MYFPPKHPNADKYITCCPLIDNLSTRYPDAGVAIVGDFNDLDLSQILLLDGYVQVVDKPTRDQNILDKVITNFSYAYDPVTILSPLGMSYHNCILWRPSSDFFDQAGSVTTKKGNN